MVVGEDVTVGADDDTAAQSGLGLRGLVTKKNWNQGSLLRGWRTALLVLMLTTAGDALRAAPLKLPAAGCPAGAGGASIRATPAPERVAPWRIQSGWRVATTK